MTATTTTEEKHEQARAKTWVRAEIQALAPYSVHPSSGLVKLDAMENPYGWPESMREEWLDYLRGAAVNRYPDATAAGLKERLREAFQLPATMDILLGNGSDELIQIIQLCLLGTDRVVLAPSPSFSMYETVAKFVGAKFVGVPLTDDHEIDLRRMQLAISRHAPAVVFLAYPNNPTGNLFDRDALCEIIRSCDGLVVMDEAYHIFAGQSFCDQLEHHDNLVVMRTLSKLGLAGLRLGYLTGPGSWLDEFEKVRMPYNVNVLTQMTVEFALQRLEVFEAQARLIVNERRRLYEALSGREDVTPFPTACNFILFRSDELPARDLFRRLVEQGVLLRSFDGSPGFLGNCLRVSVGTEQENDAFLAAMDVCLP